MDRVPFFRCGAVGGAVAGWHLPPHPRPAQGVARADPGAGCGEQRWRLRALEASPSWHLPHWPETPGCLVTVGVPARAHPQSWLEHRTLACGPLEALTGQLAALLPAGQGPGRAEKGVPAGGGPWLCSQAAFGLALSLLLAGCSRGPAPWGPLQLGAHLGLHCSPLDLDLTLRAGQAAGPCVWEWGPWQGFQLLGSLAPGSPSPHHHPVT